jgi:4-amino-4-deoxy-L-arabinose transferase-like glycosyltransferase
MTTSTQNPAESWWQQVPDPGAGSSAPTDPGPPGPTCSTAALPDAPGAPGAPTAPADAPPIPDRRPTPTWARWALAALLAGTALLYLGGLSRNGWANAYYSAAAQAAGESWTAWFFGSFDAANAITVDKPPASLWLMGLSVRLFGLSAWSVLVPQALLGVASVGVLYATVRRWFGPSAGLIAGTVLALTPVATLMFRFNNPDALLVFLLVCAAWAMGRATERGSMRWIVLAGGFVGFAFLAKMMQAFLVLPGFVAMYAVAAPIPLRRRIAHLLAALAAMVVAGGWWVAVVELWPAGSRPYIGGSQTNSMVELILGYNGVGRLTGDETGSVVPGGGQGGSMWGETGWDRLLSASYGGQVAWLLPAALAMIAVLLVTSRRGGRTDLTRAAVLGWGGWLVVTAAVISFSAGIIHEYYTVALAPAIGALVGIGSVALWARREHLWARVVAAALVAGTAWWSTVLLARSTGFVTWLGPLLLVCGLAASGLILLAPYLPGPLGRRVALGAALGGLVVALAGPAAYSLETASSTASGSLPSAGPAVTGGQGPGGAGGPGLRGQGMAPGVAGGAPGAGPGQLPPGQSMPGGVAGGLPMPPGATTQGGTPGTTGQAPGGGAAGGLLEGSTPSQAVIEALLADADQFTWVAAAVGANSAAGYQLATQYPVMAIGGFNGSDPAPTLAEFQARVEAGEIHYFIAGGQGFGGGQMGGSQSASQIAAWVAQNFSASTVDSVTLYDLTAPVTASGAGAAAQEA